MSVFPCFDELLILLWLTSSGGGKSSAGRRGLGVEFTWTHVPQCDMHIARGKDTVVEGSISSTEASFFAGGMVGGGGSVEGVGGRNNRGCDWDWEPDVHML